MKGDWVIPMIELSISHSRRSVSVNGIFTSGLSVDDVYLVLYRWKEFTRTSMSGSTTRSRGGTSRKSAPFSFVTCMAE
jgi:hypothetical protein